MAKREFRTGRNQYDTDNLAVGRWWKRKRRKNPLQEEPCKILTAIRVDVLCDRITVDYNTIKEIRENAKKWRSETQLRKANPDMREIKKQYDRYLEEDEAFADFCTAGADLLLPSPKFKPVTYRKWVEVLSIVGGCVGLLPLFIVPFLKFFRDKKRTAEYVADCAMYLQNNTTLISKFNYMVNTHLKIVADLEKWDILGVKYSAVFNKQAALRELLDLYNAMRADTLKEALNLYTEENDTREHRAQVIHLFIENIKATGKLTDAVAAAASAAALAAGSASAAASSASAAAAKETHVTVEVK